MTTTKENIANIEAIFDVASFDELEKAIDCEDVSAFFTKEQQAVISQIVKTMHFLADFHNKDDDEAHEPHIQGRIKKLEESFERHNHEFAGAFTSKPR